MYIFLKKNYFTLLTLELVNSLRNTGTKCTLYIDINLPAVAVLDHLVDLYAIV